MSLTIVTVTHRSERDIPRYVHSFLASGSGRHGASIEFVIVENSGHPEIEALFQPLRDAGFAVRLIETPNRGFGAGCNAGAAVASGDTLIFANPDLEFIDPVDGIDRVRQSAMWGTVRQLDRAGRTFAFDALPEYRTVIGSLRSSYRSLTPADARWANRIFPIGSFYIIAASLFRAVGAFDESFFMYYEEAEISRRVQQRGCLPTYFDDITVRHHAFGSSSGFEGTMEHETRGFLNYVRVTGDRHLLQVRRTALRLLSLVSASSRRRLACLDRQVAEHDLGHG